MHLRWCIRPVVLLAIALSGGPAQCETLQLGFIQHPVETPDPYFGGIALGPDGAMWFVEELGNNVGRVSTSGEVTEFPIPTPNSSPIAICSGPDGALWFTEGAGKIGRITTSGEITEFPAPAAFGIAPGPDHALWFAAFGSAQIGRITLDGTVTTFPVGINPVSITTGPDQALWFVGSQIANFDVGRITTEGQVTLYPIPTYDSGTSNITLGPDGALWFTETNVNKIGRISTSGTITEFDLPPSLEPEGITTGPDGALWFVEFTQSQIGRFTTGGTLTQIPDPSEYLTNLAFGSRSGLWLVGPYSQSVTQMIATRATMQPIPDSGPPGTQILLEGAGFAPGEIVSVCRNEASSPCSAGDEIATVNADADGTLLASGRAYFEPAGTETLVATGRLSGNVAIASFGIEPAIVPSTERAMPGETIVIDGSGFGADDSILIYFDGLGQEYAYSNAAGTFSQHAGNSVTITIPEGTTPGVHQIVGIGYYTGTSASALLYVE